MRIKPSNDFIIRPGFELSNAAANYFYFHGISHQKRKYVHIGVIKDEEGTHDLLKRVEQEKLTFPTFLLTCAKIVSCFTLVIPLLMWIFSKTSPFLEAPLLSPRNPSAPVAPLELQPASQESTTALKFYSLADQMSFWESYLNTYASALKSDKWNSQQGKKFLKEELAGINESLKNLLEEVQFAQDMTQRGQPLSWLEKQVQALIEKTDKLKPTLVQGLRNGGNTCYINSALQPLLAVGNLSVLVPDQVAPGEKFTERESILKSFKAFLKAWNARKSPEELGHKISELRRKIFEAGLLQGGFISNQVTGFQDAGQFFELILHVMGRGFTLEVTRTPLLDKQPIKERTKVEQTAQGVYYLQAPKGSIQEIVNTHRTALPHTFTPDNEWRIEHPITHREIYIANYLEQQKIVGLPPEILVVRVDHHRVNPAEDRHINFQALFKDVSLDATYDYELVGFSQNHSQVHWTSVVAEGSEWKYCNDDTVRQVDPSDSSFKHPASYMVYKKR